MYFLQGERKMGSIFAALPWEAIIGVVCAFIVEYLVGKTNHVQANSMIELGVNGYKKMLDKNQKL